MYIAQYLSETGFIDTVEEQKVQNQRKPMVIERQDRDLRQRPPDLHQQDDVPEPLRQGGRVDVEALGGKNIRVRGSKFKEQSRWSLPIEEFDPADYPATARQEVASDGR